MDDAKLDFRMGECGGNCFRKARQTIFAGDQDIRYATVFQFVTDTKPKVGALSLADPYPQNVLLASHVDADPRQLSRTSSYAEILSFS